MSRKKSRSGRPRPSDRSHRGSQDSRQPKSSAAEPSKSRKADSGHVSPAALWRETIESIAIAFVLAFLFRTFEAEAFVIPTGSMAPTLMGRHKDLLCEQCGYPYRVSASEEVDNQTNRLNGKLVVGCTCPMCRYTMDVSSDNPQEKTYTSFKGDRILVGKYPYQYRDPKRWEVTVFKFPGGAKTNYIKRIVGLPNETLRIRHGDIYTKKTGEEDFFIERKPPAKVRAMLQPVYDNDYARGTGDSLGRLLDQGWPARWKGSGPEQAPGGWQTADHVSFRTDGSAEETAWLSYQHIVPSHEDWNYLAEGQLPPYVSQGESPSVELQNNPQLITDFCGYNTATAVSNGGYYHAPGRPRLEWRKMGMHWVGDLAVECEVEIAGNRGQVLFDLVEGGKHFLCTIDVATGTATLSIPEHPDFGTPSAAAVISGPGKYRFTFANVDDQLQLWVGRRLIEFEGDATYDSNQLSNATPNEDDRLRPVSIGSHGAAVEVNHLKVYRDIYYIAVETSGDPLNDSPHFPWSYNRGGTDPVARVMSDPGQWDHFGAARPVDFQLEEGQFLALGDNSPASKDSRLWGDHRIESHVDRELLIGKAIWIYWPHSLNEIPGTNIPIRFFPNFWRMWFVE